jgi:hypothetical protein
MSTATSDPVVGAEMGVPHTPLETNMTYAQMLLALIETTRARRACWDPGVTLRRRGEDLVLRYDGEGEAPFEKSADWGNEPGDENATDWEVLPLSPRASTAELVEELALHVDGPTDGRQWFSCHCCTKRFLSARPQDPQRDEGRGTCEDCHEFVARGWVQGGSFPGVRTLEDARARLARYA